MKSFACFFLSLFLCVSITDAYTSPESPLDMGDEESYSEFSFEFSDEEVLKGQIESDFWEEYFDEEPLAQRRRRGGWHGPRRGGWRGPRRGGWRGQRRGPRGVPPWRHRRGYQRNWYNYSRYMYYPGMYPGSYIYPVYPVSYVCYPSAWWGYYACYYF